MNVGFLLLLAEIMPFLFDQFLGGTKLVWEQVYNKDKSTWIPSRLSRLSYAEILRDTSNRTNTHTHVLSKAALAIAQGLLNVKHGSRYEATFAFPHRNDLAKMDYALIFQDMYNYHTDLRRSHFVSSRKHDAVFPINLVGVAAHTRFDYMRSLGGLLAPNV